ncbi:MAG TPA: ATP-dependent helicase [Verrucomicrobiota bacterium]|nr:ATP-dependent helicase [Verrucomicrobiota bacterium]HNU51952.1 ATP-dependent helicase [Verrucomicrobiota bacterium]
MPREYALQPFRPRVDLRIDYGAELNPQQLAAVTAPPGPALVIAGAGAGKTRTLIYRVAYLIEHGVPPDRILLLTFTNKAAREMMRRVAELLGDDLGGLWGGTFHAIGSRVLRIHGERIGWRRDFTILDRSDAEELVSACLGESADGAPAVRFPKAAVLCEMFSLAVNMRQPVARVIERQFRSFAPVAGPIEALGARYAERKRRTGVVDFDDLLELWLRLLREHSDICEQYQRRFQFLLVDEYQDTNQLQSEVVNLLAAGHHNIMAVGDDSQSIYSWRGANYQNILRFPEQHPGVRLYKIETNYRSTPEILEVANAAIAPNTRQYSKHLVPVRPSGPKPVLIVCPDGDAQAAFVVQRVLELHEEGTALDRMAVLYRSHFHALELQLALTRHNLPYTITSGIRFFEQAHIKDVAAYLRLVCNPRDELAFKRLARMLPGVGPKAADRLWGRLEACRGPSGGGSTRGEGAVGKEEDAASGAGVACVLQRIATQVPRKATVGWAQFTATVAQLEDPARRGAPGEMIRLIVEAVYAEYAQEAFVNARERLDDVEQLAAFAGQFQDLETFLTQLALLTNVDAESRDRSGSGDEEQLRLSTVHQAKGLEFDVVFLIMLGDGLFPSFRSLESQEGEEEERRLFYVAITRARRELYFSYPLVRTAGSRGGDFLQQPSRFLMEIPEALLDTWDLKMPGPPLE